MLFVQIKLICQTPIAFPVLITVPIAISTKRLAQIVPISVISLKKTFAIRVLSTFPTVQLAKIHPLVFHAWIFTFFLKANVNPVTFTEPANRALPKLTAHFVTRQKAMIQVQ
jgi:hypothetical protein